MTPARARLLAAIGHPKWCPADDLELLRHRGDGRAFPWIADRMKRGAREVEQRWHRLRAVPGIQFALAEMRPATKTYDQWGES